MAKLSTLRNIGVEMERKLTSVGITTADELIQTGSEDAFMRLKLRYPKVCLVHFYTLEGAVTDTEYNHLPEDTKQRLKAFFDSLY